jgi:hypothetical protein
MPPGRSARGSSSAGIETQAGVFKDAAIPIAKASAISILGVAQPPKVTAASTPVTTTSAHCVAISSRRRSRTSASAPAGRLRRKKGVLDAVVSSATASGDAARLVISQPWATSVMNEPICETSDAVHNHRNSGWRRGAQADSSCREAGPLVMRTVPRAGPQPSTGAVVASVTVSGASSISQ